VASAGPGESLLILSDVHLGNDLNDVAPNGEKRSAVVDADLASLLAHYRKTPCGGRRWRLVIAGDFIDFVGMAIRAPAGAAGQSPTDEERAHGLGNAEADGRVKLRAVAARHRVVFEALADFVAEGHAVTLVHGNHDVEFHWDAVKDELRQLLVDLAGRDRPAGEEIPDAADLVSRIEFAPWFYYVGGVAYVEHGHQYDTLCSTAHVMAPMSPLDQRRIMRSFSDVLLRWVVRPTRGVPEYGHHRMGLVDYVLLAAHLGAGGLVRLGLRFAAAVVELFRLRRAHLTEAARNLREEHERRMAALATATRLGIERLRALAALQVPPVTRSIPKILASVLLDRLAVALVATSAIVTLACVGRHHAWAWGIAAFIAIGWLLANRQLSAQRRAWFGERLDNDEMLAERAGHLARLFPAAFVVMGHTHTPAMIPVAQGGSTYVNVGSWHEAEARESDAAPPMRAARTHLVIHPEPGGPTAQFLSWSADGPRLFVAPRVGGSRDQRDS